MTIYGVAMFHPCLPLPYQIASRATTEAGTEVTPLLVHEIEGVRKEEGGGERGEGERGEGGVGCRLPTTLVPLGAVWCVSHC